MLWYSFQLQVRPGIQLLEIAEMAWGPLRWLMVGFTGLSNPNRGLIWFNHVLSVCNVGS